MLLLYVFLGCSPWTAEGCPIHIRAPHAPRWGGQPGNEALLSVCVVQPLTHIAGTVFIFYSSVQTQSGD